MSLMRLVSLINSLIERRLVPDTAIAVQKIEVETKVAMRKMSIFLDR
jgi:hypothetical protein